MITQAPAAAAMSALNVDREALYPLPTATVADAAVRAAIFQDVKGIYGPREIEELAHRLR